MKVLSIRQPWAWLIAAGYKDVENRNWKTAFRGEFFIHAGKQIDAVAANVLPVKNPAIAFPDKYLTGGIIGRATLTDCVTRYDSPWFEGKHGFVLKNASFVDFIPCKGQLGFFSLKNDEHVKKQDRYAKKRQLVELRDKIIKLRLDMYPKASAEDKPNLAHHIQQFCQTYADLKTELGMR